MFKRVDYVNIDVTGKLKDWIKYDQDAPIWMELIRCMLDPQRKLPAVQTLQLDFKAHVFPERERFVNSLFRRQAINLSCRGNDR